MVNNNPRMTNLGLALLLLSAPCWWIGAFAFFPVVGAVYNFIPTSPWNAATDGGRMSAALSMVLERS